jgi:hypothetical protein
MKIVSNTPRLSREQWLKYVRALFEEMGFDNANADMRCRTLVTYAALYGAVFDQLSEPKQLGQIELMFAMLTRPID